MSGTIILWSGSGQVIRAFISSSCIHSQCTCNWLLIWTTNRTISARFNHLENTTHGFNLFTNLTSIVCSLWLVSTGFATVTWIFYKPILFFSIRISHFVHLFIPRHHSLKLNVDPRPQFWSLFVPSKKARIFWQMQETSKMCILCIKSILWTH